MSKKSTPTPETKPHWNHPAKPYVVCFRHNGELRELDLEKLMSLCRAYACKMGKPQVADDFANTAVAISLRKIENGFTENGHLNKASWLWSEFDDSENGSKNPNGKKALANKNTCSHSKEINDDGDTYLDTFADNSNLNPEEALLAKETLNEIGEEAITEALRDRKKERREARAKIAEQRVFRLNSEDKLYKFLLSKADSLGRIEKNPKSLSKEYGITFNEFNKIISRLKTKRKVNITREYYIVPVVKGEALKIAA